MQIFYMPILYLPQVWAVSTQFSSVDKLVSDLLHQISTCKQRHPQGMLNFETLTPCNQHGFKAPSQAGTRHLQEGPVSFSSLATLPYTSVGLAANSGQKGKEDQTSTEIPTFVIQVPSWFISSNRCPNCGRFFTACSLRYLLLGCERLLWHWDTDPRHCYSSPPQKGFRISPGGDELSPSTVPSLNNQAEKSASVVVLERWWFTTAGRQEMLPVQHCRLIAGHGKQGKTGMRRLKTKQLSCVWRWIHPLCPKLQSQCTPIWDSSPSFLTRRRVRQDMKTPKQFPKGSGEWCWWGGSCMCPCGMKSLGETCLPLSLVLMTLSLPFQPMLWWWLAARK